MGFTSMLLTGMGLGSVGLVVLLGGALVWGVLLVVAAAGLLAKAYRDAGLD